MGVHGCIACAGSERRGVPGGLWHGGAVPVCRWRGCVGRAGSSVRPAGMADTVFSGAAPALPVQPLQEAGFVDGGDDMPFNQAAFDGVVCGDPPCCDGEERHFVGRTGAASWGQAANRLDDEAEDHGGDGPARSGHAARRAGGDGTMPIPAGRVPAASAVGARRARPPLRRRSRPAPGDARARSGSLRSRASASAGSHAAARGWLAPGTEVIADALGCWSALDGIAASHRAIRTGSGRSVARMAPFKWVNTILGNIESAIAGTCRKPGPRPRRALSRQLRMALQPAIPTQIPDPPVHSRRRKNQAHPLHNTYRRMKLGGMQVQL